MHTGVSQPAARSGERKEVQQCDSSLRRLVFYVIAFWAAITLNFLLPRLMPGSPLDGLLLRYGSTIQNNPDLIKQLKASLGSADEPIWRAYPEYLHNILTGNLGMSTAQQVPVTEIIRKTLPYSIFLVGLRVHPLVRDRHLPRDARRLASRWDHRPRRHAGADGAAVVPGVLPQSRRRLLPRAEARLVPDPARVLERHQSAATTGAFVADGFRHAQLPILVIIAISAGGWLLGMRNVMITTVQEDYVTMAHAKGLKDRKVMTGYAARNAILPPLTGFAAFFASAVGGLILVEVVFSYPGVGLTIQQAALGHDYPLVQALLLVFAFTVLLANFIMDCVYVILDPRVRAS